MGNIIFYGRNMRTFFKKIQRRLRSSSFGLVYFPQTSCISDQSKNVLHWILPFHYTVYHFSSDTDKVAQPPT